MSIAPTPDPITINGVEIPMVRKVVYTREVDNADIVEIEAYAAHGIEAEFFTDTQTVVLTLFGRDSEPALRFKVVDVERLG